MLAVGKLHGWQVGLVCGVSELEDCGFSGSVRVNGAVVRRRGEQDRAYSCTVMSFQARLGGIHP